MNNNIFVTLLIAITYWVVTYFNPLLLAAFCSAAATLHVIIQIYLHLKHKQQKEKALAELLYRLQGLK